MLLIQVIRQQSLHYFFFKKSLFFISTNSILEFTAVKRGTGKPESFNASDKVPVLPITELKMKAKKIQAKQEKENQNTQTLKTCPISHC